MFVTATVTAPQDQPDSAGDDADATQQQQAPGEPDPKPETGDESPADELAKWKAIARQNETRAKANAEKAQRFDEWEQSQKSEQEKQNEELVQLREQNKRYELEILRGKVAAEKGLEPALAETLIGKTAEEMAEHADRLIAAIEKRYVARQKPKPEDVGAGASESDNVAARIAAAEKAGDFATAISLKNRAVLEKARQS